MFEPLLPCLAEPTPGSSSLARSSPLTPQRGDPKRRGRAAWGGRGIVWAAVLGWWALGGCSASELGTEDDGADSEASTRSSSPGPTGAASTSTGSGATPTSSAGTASDPSMPTSAQSEGSAGDETEGGAVSCVDCPGECDDQGLCVGGPPDGPVFLSVTANAEFLPAASPHLDDIEEQIGITIVATDPDGVADLIGGSYRQLGSAQTIGPLASAAEEGSYSATVRWADLAVPGFETGPGGEEAVIRISLFDQSGQESVYDLPILVACGSWWDPAPELLSSWGICGTCVDLATSSSSCGACGHSCQDPIIELPGSTSSEEVLIDTWCEEFGCRYLVARRGETLHSAMPTTCDALCSEHGLSCVDEAPRGAWSEYIQVGGGYGEPFPDNGFNEFPYDVREALRDQASDCEGAAGCGLHWCSSLGADVTAVDCDTPLDVEPPDIFCGPINTVACSCES